jgi:hypothetical protein
MVFTLSWRRRLLLLLAENDEGRLNSSFPTCGGRRKARPGRCGEICVGGTTALGNMRSERQIWTTLPTVTAMSLSSG